MNALLAAALAFAPHAAAQTPVPAAAFAPTGASAGEPSELAPLPPQPPPTLTLSWDDCVTLAARRSPSLTSAEYSVKAGLASYEGSYNGLLPSLTLSNGYTRNNNVNGVTLGAQGLYTGVLTANWNVFDMGAVAAIRTARAGYSQAQAAQRLASASLRYNLRAAFANVYFSQQSLEMTQRIADIQARNAEEVALRYDSGREYKGNMMNAKAQALVAQASVKQALRNLRAAAKQLERYMGGGPDEDPFEVVTVTGTLVARQPPDLPSRLQDYLEDVPSVVAQEATVDNAKASLANSESVLYPSLALNYSRFRQGGTEFPNSMYLWSAGASVSLPLFSGGPAAAYFSVKSAQKAEKAQLETLRSARNNAALILETTWAAYANAVDTAVGEQAILESYRQRNAEAEVRYAAGLLSFDNWQVIVTQWVGAEQGAISDWQNAVVTQAAWEQALGKALGE